MVPLQHPGLARGNPEGPAVFGLRQQVEGDRRRRRERLLEQRRQQEAARLDPFRQPPRRRGCRRLGRCVDPDRAAFGQRQG